MHIINAGPAQDEEQVFRLKVSLNLELGIVACHLVGWQHVGQLEARTRTGGVLQQEAVDIRCASELGNIDPMEHIFIKIYARKLKALEDENRRLKKLLAESMLDTLDVEALK